MQDKKNYWFAFLVSFILTIPLVIYSSLLFFKVKIEKLKEQPMSYRLKIFFVGYPLDIVFYILLFLPISTVFVFICTFLGYIDPKPSDSPFLISVISSIKKAMGTFLGDDFKEFLNDDAIVA
jgi:hypothetical protein